MIKPPLERIHWPNPNHILIQPIPLLAHPIRKLESPNIQSAPILEQLEDMPSPAIISHNLKELLRIHILKVFKNLKDFNQIRSQKPGLQGSETQYP